MGYGFPLSSLEQALKASDPHPWSILSFLNLCYRLGISSSTGKVFCLSSYKENTKRQLVIYEAKKQEGKAKVPNLFGAVPGHFSENIN